MPTNLRALAQTRTIGNVTYESWPLPHSAAQKILFKFLKALGSAAEADGASDAAQFAALARALPEEDLTFIASRFGDASAYTEGEVKGAPLVIQSQDLHFAGRFDYFLRWLLFCAEVNFSGFFDTGRRNAIAADFKRLSPEAAPETAKTE